MIVTKLHLPLLMILAILPIGIWECDASDGRIKNGAKLRVKTCERAGYTSQALKACKETEEGYKRAMEPIWTKKNVRKSDCLTRN